MIKRILIFIQLFLVKIALSQVTTLTTGTVSGAFSWTVPCGVTQITVNAWGGGGGGGGDGTSNSIGGAGGSSGGFVTNVFNVSFNQVITFTVGAGGTAGSNTTAGGAGGNTTFSTMIANGGAGGAANSAAATATAGGSGGTVTNGGAGAGGGANGGLGGTNPAAGSGAGGAGATGGANNAVAGSVPGGGGGGADDEGGASNNGAAGGNGRVTIAFVFPDINAVASSTLASCTTTSAALSATAITTPGWTGSWQCVGCTGISIASPTSAATTASGFAPGSTNYFQWVATYSTGCSYYDDLTITVPACAITNNNCTNATSLTIDAGLMCSQSTTGASAETGECYYDLNPPNAGLSQQSLWYRFTATNDSLVLNIAGYGSFGPPSILVYGPFASGAGCVPGCASATITGGAVQGLTGDPGVHALLTGLATTGNNQYLVQVMGFGNLNWDFCINVANPAINSTAPSNALVISNCGATYNGSTNGGYFGSGSGPRKANLDNNLNTFVSPYTNTTGYDVTFVVNNLSWFKFCTVNAGTFNVQFDVLSCVFSGASSGSQMAILTGSNTSLTNIWEATNPTTPSTPIQTSPNFTLAAGGCAYMVVDGFAGDACAYSYVLTNVSGGCVLLPVELISFNALLKDDIVELNWATASEKDNAYFTVEKSSDGVNFEAIDVLKGWGTKSDATFYSTIDNNPLPGVGYYRLKQTDFDGNYFYSKIVSVENGNDKKLKFAIIPNPTEEGQKINILFSAIPKSDVEIHIINANGISVFEEKMTMGENKIEIPKDLNKGVYFVKVISGNLIQTKKMIIK